MTVAPVACATGRPPQPAARTASTAAATIRRSAILASTMTRGGAAATRSTDAAVEWLLGSDEPAIRYLARRDVLGEDVQADPEEIVAGPKVRALLEHHSEGHPYRKWMGPHWRLVSRVELAVPPGQREALEAAERVLGWLTGARHRESIRPIDGLARVHASGRATRWRSAAGSGWRRTP